MNEALIQLISQTGIWCAAAFAIGKIFIDYINKKDALERQDFKEREERVYGLLEKQEEIMSQQKDLLTQQVVMSQHNKEMLDKLTDIQMLHTNRLDRIEDRQAQLEEEVKKIGSKLI